MDEGSPLRQSLVSIGETIQARGGELLQQVLSSAAGVVNVLVFLVVVPVVAFYMLLDWDRLIARIDELLPRDHRRHDPQAGRPDRPDAGQFHPRSGHGLPDPRHLLRRGADGGGAAIRAGRGAGRGAVDLHPLCRRAGGRRACRSAWRCSSSGATGG